MERNNGNSSAGNSEEQRIHVVSLVGSSELTCALLFLITLLLL